MHWRVGLCLLLTVVKKGVEYSFLETKTSGIRCGFFQECGLCAFSSLLGLPAYFVSHLGPVRFDPVSYGFVLERCQDRSLTFS